MIHAGAAAVAAAAVALSIPALLPHLIADEAGLRLLRPHGRRPRLEWVLAACGVLLAVAVQTTSGLAGSPGDVPAGTASSLGSVWAAVATGAVAGASPALAHIDVRIRRLPDRIVLPLIAFVVAVLAVAWVAGAEPVVRGGAGPLGALLAGAGCGLFLLLVSVVGGRGRGLAIGLGDVKLAVLVGSLTALPGLGAVLWAFAVAQACALVEALWRVVIARQGVSTRIAYGPHLLIGMWTGPLLHAMLR